MSIKLLLRLGSIIAFSFAVAPWAIATYSIATYTIPAFAQTATAFKDSTGKVFLYGLQPSTKVGVGITADFTKTIQANSCGLVVVKFTSSFPVGTFQIDGQTINPTSITAVQTISTDCTQMTSYPGTFKTAGGAIAIRKSPSTDYKVVFPNHTVTRQVLANACGYAVLKNTNITLLNLPTITGGRASFAYSNLPLVQPLSCVKGTMYFPVGFNLKSAIASATTSTSTTASTTTTTTAATTTQQASTASTATTVSSQTAQPVAVKSGNNLIISSIPPGTYTVANAANLGQSKVYTVTSKACLVSDRTQIGSPSKFLVSRQGLTFPIDWASLTTIPAVAIPQC